jgi:hypothetical protein
MKYIFNNQELKILKGIAKKTSLALLQHSSKKEKVGYIQCLNSIAYASGYDNWKNLNSEHKIGLVS